METSYHGQLWLKLGWNMLMPWFCFHLESLLGGGLPFDFRIHRMALCEPQQHVLVPSDASPSIYLWAIIWGTSLNVYIGRNPIMHSYQFLWKVARWVMLYKNVKNMQIHCTSLHLSNLQFKKQISYTLLLLLESLLALFYSLDSLRPLQPVLFNVSMLMWQREVLLCILYSMTT